MKHISSIKKWYGKLTGANNPRMHRSGLTWRPDDHEQTNHGTPGFKPSKRRFFAMQKADIEIAVFRIVERRWLRNLERWNDEAVNKIAESANGQELAYLRKATDQLPPPRGFDATRYQRPN